jgi:sRNA-binding regulator protein Hfq
MLAEQQRAEKLLTLARTNFDATLSQAEEELLRHSCQYDDPAEFVAPAPDDTAQPKSADAARDATGRPLRGWQGPVVRSALLRWLLTDSNASSLLEVRGVRVWNARIADPLDLAGCRTAVRLELRYCLVESTFDLSSTDLPALSLRNSTLERGLQASFLQLRGSLLLTDISAADTIRLDGASISGGVQVSNTTLSSTEAALSMQNATIATDLDMTPGFTSAGTLFFRGIRVGGLMNLSGARLTKTGPAMNANNSRIDGNVLLQNGFQCAGSVRMLNAQIGGQFSCHSAKFTGTGDALTIDSTSIGGGAFLHGEFESFGTIRMVGTEIGEALECDGAKLRAAPFALTIDRAKVRGSVFLRNGFESAGEVRLSSAEIGSNVECSSAILTAGGLALSAVRTVIRGSVFLSPGFQCAGEVRMNGVDIGGELLCNGAKLTATLTALSLAGAKIAGSVLLRDGFKATGEVRLADAKIDGQVTCVGSLFGNFNCMNSQVKGDLIWREMKDPAAHSMDLRGASFRGIADDSLSWPAKGRLKVLNLTTGDLRPLEPSALRTMGRITWLRRQPDSDLAEPQPWIQLAALLEGKGHKRAAKDVLFELRRHQSKANRKNSKIPWIGRWWDLILASLEQQPLRILWSILILTALCGGVFQRYEKYFAPTNDAAYKPAANSDGGKDGPPMAYPKFQPYVYALENVLPVVKLGQDDHWAPDHRRTSSLALYWWLMATRWLLILAGYVQGGILAAAVSARFRA